MKKKRFCVAVILFNPESSIIKQLEIYNRQFEKVYVLDNSTAQNNTLIEYLNSVKKVEYINLNGNKGISTALNIAFERSINEGFDYILTMDQDTDFPERDIKLMKEFIESDYKNNNVGIYAPNFRKQYYKGEKVIYSNPKYPIDEITEVQACMTSGSFVSCKVLKEVLPLDNFFIAHVDTDLSAAIRIIGHKVVLNGSVIFNQQLGRPVKANWFNMKFNATNHEPLRYYYMIRNCLYLKKKYSHIKPIKNQTLTLGLKYIFKIVTSETQKIKKIKFAYKGFKDYKRGTLGKYQD